MLRPALLATCIAACGGGAHVAPAGKGPTKTPVTAAPAPSPKIVITLVVDQLAGWIAEQRIPLLPETGGFARLRREGTWVIDMRYAHAITDTAPGHSALYTALSPRDTNIFANELLDPETRRYVSILRDPKLDLVTPLGPAESFGVSLSALADSAETIADRLRARNPKSYIVSLSLKDRGALFGCGRHPDVCLWYESRANGFVTSTAFAQELPKWSPSKEKLISAASHPWELKDEDFVKAHALTPDDQPGEGDGNGLGRTFPHIPATSTSSPLQTLRYTPAMDRVLLDAALASIDEKQERAMLLAISLSTFDYVGHVWGPDSWESWDELVRLDYELARFFTHLDRKVGADGWSLVLSADHGTTSMPEVPESAHPWCKPGASNRLAQPCGAVTRVIPAALTEDLKTLAEKTLGKGDWILGVADPYVYFTTNALSHPKRAELENAVIDALKKHPEVDTVMRGGRREFCGKSDSVEDGICHSLAEKTKDTLYIALKPGSFFDSGHALGRGSSHGSPYPFDRSVPLFVRALARAHPGEVIRDRVSFESFAKTVCSLLGVEPLAAAKDARDFAP